MNWNLQNFLPAWNASLNALSFFLLCLGLYFVKTKNFLIHEKIMKAAFFVSALFLASYLVYHGLYPSRPFRGEGWVRPLYFAMLISHIILAVVILPWIFRLLFLARQTRFLEHARLARWIWPAWAYTSVTGVLIYLFLYHWFAGETA